MKEGRKGTRNTQHKWKTNSTGAYLNSTISLVTLNVNGLNIQIKGIHYWAKLYKKARLNYMLSVREHFKFKNNNNNNKLKSKSLGRYTVCIRKLQWLYQEQVK